MSKSKDLKQDKRIAKLESANKPEMKYGYVDYTISGGSGQQNTNAISVVPLTNLLSRGSLSANQYIGESIRVKRIKVSLMVWGNTAASAYNFFRFMIVRAPGVRTSAQNYIGGAELLKYYDVTNIRCNNVYSDYNMSTVSTRNEQDKESIRIYKDIKMNLRGGAIEVDANYRKIEFDINFKNPVKINQPNGDASTISNGIYLCVFGGKSITATDNPYFQGLVTYYYFDE